MGRVMLATSDLPRRYWPWAYKYACRILNIVASSPVASKSPFELMRGEKPDAWWVVRWGAKVTVKYKEGKVPQGHA